MKKKIAFAAGILALSMTFAAAATTAFAAPTPRMVYDTAYTASEGTVYVCGMDEADTTAPVVLATKTILAARKCEMQNVKGTVKDEFYLGLLDDAGEPLTGDKVVSSVSLYSKDADIIKQVLYWNEAKNVWQDIAFSVADGEVLLNNVKIGAYRFIIPGYDKSSVSAVSVPSVHQQGIGVTGDDDDEARVVFVYDNVADSVLTDEARSTMNAALKDASASGTTAASMGISGQKVVSKQFYLGMHDEHGNLIDTSAGKVSLAVDSAAFGKTICGVYRWNGKSWTSVSYSVSGKAVTINSAHTGVYRFVSEK